MISKKNKFLAGFLSAILFVSTALVGVSAAPKRVTIKNVKVSYNDDYTKANVKFTLKKIKGAKGYQIRYGYKKNLKGAKVKFVKNRKVTLKKFKLGKTIYIKARAKLKKGYSKFSLVKKVKIAQVYVDKVASDHFKTIDEMISKAKTYKTIDDVYKSAGLKNDDSYYSPFSEKLMTRLLVDRKLTVPTFPEGTTIDFSALGPHCYVFSIVYKERGFVLNIYNTKDIGVEFSELELYDTINGVDIYTIYTNSQNMQDFLLMFYDGYPVVLNTWGKNDKSIEKEFLSSIVFTTVDLDK